MARMCSVVVFEVIAILLSWHMDAAQGQEPRVASLFQEADLAKLKLNEKQEKVLDRIKKSPATVEYSVVTLVEDSLDDGNPIIISLPGKKQLMLEDYKLVDGEFSRTLSWKGKEPSFASLTLTGERGTRSVTGLIHNDKHIFSVEPLSGGLQVIVWFDQTKLPKDHP